MTQGAAKAVVINVEGMHCENCVGKVRKALEGVKGVTSVDVSLAEKKARVVFDPASANTAGLMGAVRTAGFQASGFAKG